MAQSSWCPLPLLALEQCVFQLQANRPDVAVPLGRISKQRDQVNPGAVVQEIDGQPRHVIHSALERRDGIASRGFTGCRRWRDQRAPSRPSLYTDDAVVLPPGSPIVKGRADIEAFWKKAAEGLGDAKLTTVDVKPLGPAAARETGHFSLKTKASPSQELVGKYVVVWEKLGTEWKLSADIWNEGK